MELPACPVETTLMLIGDKWKVLILRDLMDGTKRFGELKNSIGHVTQKVLTAQLRDMEAKGLLTRRVYAEVPPRVEYTFICRAYLNFTSSTTHFCRFTGRTGRIFTIGARLLPSTAHRKAASGAAGASVPALRARRRYWR